MATAGGWKLRLAAGVGTLALLVLAHAAPVAGAKSAQARASAASPSELMAASARDLATAGRLLRIGELLRPRGQRIPASAPTAAVLTVEVSTQGPAGPPMSGPHNGKAARAGPPTPILASGTLTFVAAGRSTIVVVLTPLGRSLLAHRRHAHVYVWARLDAPEGSATSADPFTLRR